MPQSVYLPIELNDTLRNNKVGVFISDHVNLTADINFIVYFHGHIIPRCETQEAPFVARGMEYYWQTPLFKCLRDDLDASKANAVLVAPALDKKLGEGGGKASYGNLNADGKFDFLVDETLTRLKSNGTLPATARAGKIILAGHSAGGLPMLRILEATNSLKPNIAECWGFECCIGTSKDGKLGLPTTPTSGFGTFGRPAPRGIMSRSSKATPTSSMSPMGRNTAPSSKRNGAQRSMAAARFAPPTPSLKSASAPFCGNAA